ncbi:hypothetical protein HMSSN139_65460 [Paenibacillus sp. HMSSN-139]|nr:hypothetical protein HMSSN139_65460 [Paenibacillus sp. HMSSN-139]
MADSLVIVESPAKAKTIGKYLGSKYIVKASMGHVRDLPKSQIGVEVENDFSPKYITIRGKGSVLKELKDASKKSEKNLSGSRPRSRRRSDCLASGPRPGRGRNGNMPRRLQ